MSFPPPPPAQPHWGAGGQPSGMPAYPGAPPEYFPGSQPGYTQQGYPGQGVSGPGYPTGYPSYTDQRQNNRGDTAESEDFAASEFSDKNVRRKFISKVYSILSVQLLVTFAFVSVFLFVKPVQNWVQRNQWFYWLSYAIFFVTYMVLACCTNVRRRFPGNFIALAVFTLAFSYMAGTITSFYTVNSVLVCLGITIGVTVSVSIAAACCPCDITKCWALIAVLSVLLFLFGIVCTIVYFIAGYNSTLHAVYGGVAAVVFTFYLAYDTQMILGGRKFELSPEEYIFGALQLYLDVVNIFLALLAICGVRS